VVFSYSDVSHVKVMNLASRALATGADFVLLSAEKTMLKSKVPVVSVCATRTGCGKSPVSRRTARLLKEQGLKVVAIRHPMPEGDLVKQAVQRFAVLEVPVVKQAGQLKGSEAVIDKDRCSALLAMDLEVELLVFSTGMTYACLPFGKKNVQPLFHLAWDKARAYLRQGEFAAGSMGPKIEAALRFLEFGGKQAIHHGAGIYGGGGAWRSRNGDSAARASRTGVGSRLEDRP
jgi:Amino acid kinase family